MYNSLVMSRGLNYCLSTTYILHATIVYRRLITSSGPLVAVALPTYIQVHVYEYFINLVFFTGESLGAKLLLYLIDEVFLTLFLSQPN